MLGSWWAVGRKATLSGGTRALARGCWAAASPVCPSPLTRLPVLGVAVPPLVLLIFTSFCFSVVLLSFFLSKVLVFLLWLMYSILSAPRPAQRARRTCIQSASHITPHPLHHTWTERVPCAGHQDPLAYPLPVPQLASLSPWLPVPPSPSQSLPSPPFSVSLKIFKCANEEAVCKQRVVYQLVDLFMFSFSAWRIRLIKLRSLPLK